MRNSKSNLCRRGTALFFFLLIAIVPDCFAHPMGNFSINHYSKIKIGKDAIDIRYVIDMAEIPTYQEMRQEGISPVTGDPSTSRYLDGEGQLLKEGLLLEIDGRAIALDATSRQVTFADGAGGLPTMKIGLVFRGELHVAGGTHTLSYFDNNFAGRAGWKEIVVEDGGVAIRDNSASSTDRSRELTNYSSDALNSPPQQLSAVVGYMTPLSVAQKGDPEKVSGIASGRIVAHGTDMAKHLPALHRQLRSANSGALSSQIPVQSSQSVAIVEPLQTTHAKNTPRNRFTELMSTQGKLSLWLLLSAGLIAAGLGALHALEPGHGKTVVAAYLVGARGTARHAVLLGIVVTAAHTAGVYLLGAITLYASRYIVPDHLYPWLGAISGLSIAGLGMFIFLRHLTGESGEHSHVAGERHSHSFLSLFARTASTQTAIAASGSSVAASVNSTPKESALSLRELFMLGITGGIVPCPAALVVLLSAFSLHRIGFGLFLITAFSSGLAIVLVSVGLMMVYAKRFMSARLQLGGAVTRYLPILSSAFIAILGIGITVSAVASIQIGQGLFTREKLIPCLTVILLGLFLGMRHSTDPDHVVAVSTIVSRHASVRSSATIGLLWGIGHTVTIFLVGSAIIVFGVVIPPRLGLSMEFSVALMLILLGLLNLTGIMRWITERLTASKSISATLQSTDDVAPAAANSGIVGHGLLQSVAVLLEGAVGKLGVYQTIRPLVVGLVHGLAGSAAVALLVLSTIKSPFWATAYLLVFGFGTVVGMMIMTSAISIPFVYAGKKFLRINRHLIALSGFASMAFGVFLVYHIGFIDGLFMSHVHWIPQ
jgi:nickel/cobalt exporter